MHPPAVRATRVLVVSRCESSSRVVCILRVRAVPDACSVNSGGPIARLPLPSPRGRFFTVTSSCCEFTVYALVVFSALYYINRPRGPTDANAAVACVWPLVQLVHRGGGKLRATAALRRTAVSLDPRATSHCADPHVSRGCSRQGSRQLMCAILRPGCTFPCTRLHLPSLALQVSVAVTRADVHLLRVQQLPDAL